MSGIDKIYGTKEQWCDLFRFLARRRPQYCRFLYPPHCDGVAAISNFPAYADKWLFNNCELKWVVAAIKKQYGGRKP